MKKTKFLSLLLLGLLCSIGNVLADETYYLQDPDEINGTPALTGDFYTEADLTFNVGKMFSSSTYKKGLTFAGNINGAGSNMKNADRFVRYDCKTNNTEITVLVYANSSGKKYYDWTIQENGTIGSACTMSSVNGRDATNGEIISKTYTITNSTRTSFYVSVGASSNVSVVQMIAVEKGTALPAPCEAGYQVNFNKGRYAGKSATVGYLDKTSEIAGLEICPYSDYYGSSSGNIQLSTNNTHYIKFTVANPIVLNFTTANVKKYTVSKTKGDTENQITPSANITKKINLTSSGEYYINPQESGLQATGLSFSAAPKVTYNANGGTKTMDATYFTVAENSFTAPSGQVFDGWNTQADGEGTDYAVDQEIESDVTLYAQWRTVAAKHHVVYNGGGATGTLPTQDDVEEGQNFIVASAAGLTAPSGKIFKCWNDGILDYEPGDEYTMGTSDVELTAEWASRYTISYSAGSNGTGSIDEGEKIEGVAFTLSSSTFTRSGYLQTGWATSDGGAKVYELGGSYTNDEDIELYPVWEKINAAIVFDYTEGKSISELEAAGWTFNSADFAAIPAADNGTYVNLVSAMTAAGLNAPETNGMQADAIAFAKNTGAYAMYDLGEAKTILGLSATLYGGSSSAFNQIIQYIGADGSAVKKEYTNSLGAGNWKANSINKIERVSGVRYVKVFGASKWVVMTSLSISTEYSDFVSVSTLAGRNFGTMVTPADKKLDFSAVSEDVTAYIAMGLNGESDAVRISSIDVVPANTPIIIKSEIQGATVNVPVTTSEASSTTGNLLVAGDGTTAWNGTSGYTYYYLASDAFHKATSGTLQSGKAYLKVEGDPALAPSLRIVEGEQNATNIENVEANDKAVKFIENGRILILRDGITYDALGRIVK